MHMKTNLIVDFELKQVTQTGSSSTMERAGCFDVLQRLEAESNVSLLTTDRHCQIRAMMTNEFPHIKHQFDIYHVDKSLRKKIADKAKRKGYEMLQFWLKALSNHLWWCCATCSGNAELLKEKWLSFLHHVTDVHSWNCSHLFHKCAHRALTRAERKEKAWLKRDSPAYEAIEAIVTDKQMLKDLDNMTEFCHTGGLENFHSMLLHYCPKRLHFSYEGMVGRTQLAIMDNNSNTDRSQQVDKEGKPVYDIVFTKQGRKWVAKKVTKPKSYEWVKGLVQDVSDAKLGRLSLNAFVSPDLPSNIAPEPKPIKDDVIRSHKSRFVNKK